MVDPVTLGLVGAGLWGLWEAHKSNKKKAAKQVIEEWDKRLTERQGAPGKSLPRKSQSDYDALLEALKIQNGDRCVYHYQGGCSDDLQIGKIVPPRENGTNYSSNLQLICTKHRRKPPSR